jgi:hypothetical protein
MGSSADITAFPTDRFFLFRFFVFVFMVTDAGGGDFLLLFQEFSLSYSFDSAFHLLRLK